MAIRSDLLESAATKNAVILGSGAKSDLAERLQNQMLDKSFDRLKTLSKVEVPA